MPKKPFPSVEAVAYPSATQRERSLLDWTLRERTRNLDNPTMRLNTSSRYSARSVLLRRYSVDWTI
jgi:hypothetical protein